MRQFFLLRQTKNIKSLVSCFVVSGHWLSVVYLRTFFDCQPCKMRANRLILATRKTDKYTGNYEQD